jgi:hypothetical protein
LFLDDVCSFLRHRLTICLICFGFCLASICHWLLISNRVERLPPRATQQFPEAIPSAPQSCIDWWIDLDAWQDNENASRQVSRQSKTNQDKLALG